MAYARDTHFPQVIGIEFGQNRLVDVIVAEYIFELAQTKTSRPIPDVHDRIQSTKG
jgi:hypothetical protein